MRARRAGHRRSALARGRAQLTVSAACAPRSAHPPDEEPRAEEVQRRAEGVRGLRARQRHIAGACAYARFCYPSAAVPHAAPCAGRRCGCAARAPTPWAPASRALPAASPALRAGADAAAAPPLAHSGHTDAAALEALKQRWVKAGKPNLSDKCVTLRLTPRKTRPAAASWCLLRSLTRVSPRCPAQPGLLSACRVQKRAWCDHTLASHNTKTSRRLRPTR